MKDLKTILETIDIPTLESNINWNVDQRGIASVIEKTVIDILSANPNLSVKQPTGAKSMADVTVNDISIDIKASDMSRKFKMPNLISIDILRKKVLNVDGKLLYLFVVYDSELKKIQDIFTQEVTEINWEYLHICNLGKGQLQIINFDKFYNSSNRISPLTKGEWIDTLKNTAVAFYKKLELKTEERRADWMTWER